MSKKRTTLCSMAITERKSPSGTTSTIDIASNHDAPTVGKPIEQTPDTFSICHDLIILISDWYLPITYHFRKITLQNHLQKTHHPSHPNSSIHDTNQSTTSSLSDDQILLNSDSLTSCHNHSMAILGLYAITIPIFSRGIFGRKHPLPTLEFTR